MTNDAAGASTNLWGRSATELTTLVRTREVSAREVTLAALARLESVNGRTNAVVVTLRDAALAKADAVDGRLARGEAVGPLAGVPVTVKDNVDQVGLANVNGVAAMKGLIAKEDHPVVRHLDAADAVILGRTNTPAFSFRYDTDNAVYGRTHNPWSRAHTIGGSSGGAAAAVATGACALAHGNDYGGSIRYPAHCAGVLGLRPTMGRVPTYNATAAAERPITGQLMSVQGLLGRHVADLRAGLAVVSAFDARDPFWVPAPLVGPPVARRVAVSLGDDPSLVHPAVADAVAAAARALADAGYEVVDATPPSLERADELFLRLVLAEVRALAETDMRNLGDDALRRALDLNLAAVPDLSRAEYMQMLAERARILRQWLLFFEEAPLLLCPVSLGPPFPIGFDHTTPDAHAESGRAQRMLRVMNVLGLPALSAPVAMTTPSAEAPRGQPVGVQLVASRYREDVVLDAAAALEAAFPPKTPIEPLEG